MTWAPFVAALVIMFFARHRPLLVRWTSLARRDRVAGRVAVGLLGLRPRARPASSSSEEFALVPSLGISYLLRRSTA